MTETLIIALLASLWVAAWLHWCFSGEIRHFAFALVFPASWRAGRSAEDVMLMDSSEFAMFLAAESEAPAFVRGVLGCPGCLSAWLSGAGIVLALLSGCLSVWLAPLVWGAAAWTGHRLHSKLG